MKRPNFFIVGAPKCGTTALSEYLGAHPQIFMSDPKEPHYFAVKYGVRVVHTEDDYLALFAAAEENHLAVGEASVWYLRCPKALSKINDFAPDAKLLVMLRNPVDLAHSMHAQAVFNCAEDETDFERAWRLQDRRALGKSIPKHCRNSTSLEYGEIGKLGEQVRLLLDIWPREKVKFIPFDEFSGSTEKVYDEVLQFLGVDKWSPDDFKPVNERKVYRSRSLALLAQRTPKKLVHLAENVKGTLGIEKLGIIDRINKLNTVSQRRSRITPEFRRELISYFYGDVRLLEEILELDLENWPS